MKKNFLFLVIAAISFAACEKTDPPTVDFFAEINGYEVTFTSAATDTDSYLWDFGDGNTSTQQDPVHEYTVSGEYDVTLTVKGDGGEAEIMKEVSIAASDEEMLTGGPDAPNGKTWLLSRVATIGTDGAGNIRPHFPTDVLPFAGNDLEGLGIGDAYDIEYTFFSDGSYQIDPINGQILAGWIYSQDNLESDIVHITQYGIFVVNYEPPSDMGWEMEHGNFTMEVATEHSPTEATEETIEFEDVQYIEFSGDGFIAVKDFYNKAVIRNIEQDKMQLSVFIHSSQVIRSKPSLHFTLTFEAK